MWFSRRCLAPAAASKAFMNITIGGRAAPQTLRFELFTKTCPVACENFAKLCSGEMVLPQVSSVEGLGEPSFGDQFLPQLCYRGSSFHRVRPGYLVQGGDIVSASGEDQLSVFGETFDAPEEVEQSNFNARGMLGTAVSAPHLNGSQFFILTAKDAPHLNKTCIAFGRLMEGWETIAAMEAVGVGIDGHPSEVISIVECGVE